MDERQLLNCTGNIIVLKTDTGYISITNHSNVILTNPIKSHLFKLENGINVSSEIIYTNVSNLPDYPADIIVRKEVAMYLVNNHSYNLGHIYYVERNCLEESTESNNCYNSLYLCQFVSH